MKENGIKADEGFFFGIGLFETMAVRHGQAMLQDLHVQRLAEGLRDLQIDNRIWRARRENRSGREEGMEAWLSDVIDDFLAGLTDGPVREHGVLKLTVTAENLLFTTRENPYTERQYREGLRLCFSPVLRNETSPFTYYKTLNGGDNHLVHRRARRMGYDEAVFVNTRGEICEGSVSNVFFTRGDQVVTPPVRCGLLPGTVRRYLLAAGKNRTANACGGAYPVCREQVVRADDLQHFTGMFVTNALMGIMPVRSLGDYRFPDRQAAERLRAQYLRDIGQGR